MAGATQSAGAAWRTTVKRVCLILGAVAIAAVAVAAVHDIAAGERDLTAEWAFLVFAGLLGACGVMSWLMRLSRPPR